MFENNILMHKIPAIHSISSVNQCSNEDTFRVRLSVSDKRKYTPNLREKKTSLKIISVQLTVTHIKSMNRLHSSKVYGRE